MHVQHTLTLAEAADRRGVHYNTLKRAVGRGELTVYPNAAGTAMLSVRQVIAWQPPHRPGPKPTR